MRKIFSSFLLFVGVVYFVNAELNVEWIDDNTIVVTGYGYGDITNETALGSCTNCLAISPDEMRAIKMDILSTVGVALLDCDTVLQYSSYIQDICNGELSGISTFQRFANNPPDTSISQANFVSLTNYLASVQNKQTDLVNSKLPIIAARGSYGVVAAYNNGIYDYATEYATPYLNGILVDAEQIERSTLDIKSSLGVISNTVVSITEESCQSCGSGGGTNDTSCSSCPCEEQWDALLDYIRHIDDDQHRRYTQLHDISNRVFNIDKSLDSYAKLVSGILYNDATIVVDNGENSWSNVYRRGYSDLYDYDKSNILQRIELLLFGVSYNTSTNWGDVASSSTLESDKADIEDTFNDLKDIVSDGYTSLDTDVRGLRDSIRDFFSALNFFGAGSFGEFSLTDPYTVFGVYDFEIGSNGHAEDFRSLQRISRTAFQIVYWTAGVVFMLFFWFRFVGFVTRVVLSVVKYLNNVLT